MNTYDDLTRHTIAANGMLPQAVYQAVFDEVRANGCHHIVEIGTAHGAATIAMALGAMAQQTRCRIWTIDRLGGQFSSRSIFGSPEQNEQIVLRNLQHANVADLVQLFVGSSDDFFASGSCPDQIDFLLLDADGRIDRDLMYFYPRMPPGAPIIIDDVDSVVLLSRTSTGTPYIDNKHRLTALLLDAFIREGYVLMRYRLANTAFCQRTAKSFDYNVFSTIALQAYRELALVDVNDPYWLELSQWNDSREITRQALKIRARIPSWIIGIARNLVHFARQSHSNHSRA